MATYLYRCAEHGLLEHSCAMGAAPAGRPCPECGRGTARVFTAPRLSFGSPARRALIERAERTSEVPDVVSAPPPRARARSVPADPKLARLPRW